MWTQKSEKLFQSLYTMNCAARRCCPICKEDYPGDLLQHNKQKHPYPRPRLFCGACNYMCSEEEHIKAHREEMKHEIRKIKLPPNIKPLELEPMLSSFMTEIHHISGEGEDGGELYWKLLRHENTLEDIALLELFRALYPNSGYSAKTRGLLSNLRTAVTNEMVLKYHDRFYRPNNMTIIVSGKINPDRVFAALQTLLEKTKRKPRGREFVKPWQSSVEYIKASRDIKVLFPSDEEKYGLVYIGYLGPNCVTDCKQLLALRILLDYLTNSSISPLRRSMTETEEPFVRSISYKIYRYSKSALIFEFQNAPINKIDEILNRFQEVMKKISSGEEAIDTTRLESIIKRDYVDRLTLLDDHPDKIADFLIPECIYGTNKNDLQELLDFKKHHDYLLKISEAGWIDLLSSYFVEANYVCLRAFPSNEERYRIFTEEQHRLENQKIQLGEEGMRDKGALLSKARDLNEVEIPNFILNKIPVACPDGIDYHHLRVHKSSGVSQVENILNFAEIPMYTEVYDVHTKFIHIRVAMNTECLCKELRLYIPLLLELLLKSPVMQRGKLIPFEEVAAALERNTIFYGKHINSVYSHVVMVSMKVEPQKYKSAVNWLLKVLYCSVFTADRIRAVVSNMLNEMKTDWKNGRCMAFDILTAIFYSEESNVKAWIVNEQQKFLTEVLKCMENFNESAKVLNDLNAVRKILMRRTNLALHIAVDISKCVRKSINLSKVWDKILDPEKTPKLNQLRAIPNWKQINYKGYYLKCGANGIIIGMKSVDGNFLFHSVEALHDNLSPDWPVLLLYLEYLRLKGGLLDSVIRGQGLAFDFSINAQSNQGLIQLYLDRAYNVVTAFKGTKKAIEAHLNDDTWDEKMLLFAKCYLINKIVKKESSPGQLVGQALLLSYQKVPANYNHMLAHQVAKVTEEQLREVGKKYISKLFSRYAKTAIVVSRPDKVKGIIEGFSFLNIELIGASSLDDNVLHL